VGRRALWNSCISCHGRTALRSGNLAGKAVVVLASGAALAHLLLAARTSDPLPSWNEGAAKQAILKFVADVTAPDSPSFVPANQRIATFDNDGTLWVEQPMYTEMAFSIARARSLASSHPEWRNRQPFKAAIEGDRNGLADAGERGAVELLLATHSGLTSEDFATAVTSWIAHAEHPRFHRLYTRCVYQPMLEVISYLQANEFKTYIVSGGTLEFMRPWVERTYGIPPEQTIGSSIQTEFQSLDARPVLMQLPRLEFVDDKAGKPVAIGKFIGRRPIASFGNSDGDQQMLEWTAAGTGSHLMLVVHHTDQQREYAYDRNSPVGTLDKLLTEAEAKAWIVVNMKLDWKTIFPI